MSVSRRSFLQAASLVAAQGVSVTAANDRIQVGIIGTGARAQELMEALLLLPQAEITGVVDAYKGRVERALERTGNRARAYSDYREILADKSIDAVVVGTPDHWHARIVLDAIAAGKDVYCEKPLTYRTSEGGEIIRAAREAQRIVQVGSQDMSSALEQKAREIIKSGALGQITMIRASYNRNTPSGAWIYPIPRMLPRKP